MSNREDEIADTWLRELSLHRTTDMGDERHREWFVENIGWLVEVVRAARKADGYLHDAVSDGAALAHHVLGTVLKENNPNK